MVLRYAVKPAGEITGEAGRQMIIHMDDAAAEPMPSRQTMRTQVSCRSRTSSIASEQKRSA